MNPIVIANVPVAELPPAWRAKLVELAESADVTVTIHIEEEAQLAAVDERPAAEDPAFGVWRDRTDMGNVESYLRSLRGPRYGRDASRRKP